ncbi:putative two-component system sensor kinase [Streptomyces bingchenggensis BCW-1]|uniref:histidine kinase n=1 Tax=Streptomyces bingchenggensis (strain BCW-1) TaxID=749414 RepID=D7CD76_STRBB|nr:putative two-component system sensor kinase [Streptomyces bingchenggensis BCW-1]
MAQRLRLDAVTPLAVGPGLARPYRWLTAHPHALDALLAVVVFALMLIGAAASPHTGHRSIDPIDPLFVLLAAVAAGVLVLRRRFPIGVLAVTAALTVVEVVTAHDGPPRTSIVFGVAVALCTVAVRTDRSTTLRVGLITVAVLTGVAMLFGVSPWYAQENFGIFTWTGLAAAAGDAARSRRAYIAAIEERAVRAERTREEEARRRVAEERLRIARELHDVVAHHIALVNVQAGVASHVMDNRPDQAKQALAHVRQASRSALDELRATVGLLRQYGDPAAPTEPAPGLAVLDQLVDGFVKAGLRVDVEAVSRDGLGPLAGSVDLTAYRIVQEALTNVHKHAGPDAKAQVRIVRTSAVLLITVDDDGPCAEQPPAEDPGGGHGLIGMRERVAALGGNCEAGPRPQGGFRVRVRLPLQMRRGEPRDRGGEGGEGES